MREGDNLGTLACRLPAGLLGLQLLSKIYAQALMSFNKRLGFTR